ncbi:MAG: YkgJ family cysteine cluster protein [Deltaproteobacteria bacterium]|nr:YkgJ family cysteine cluster protein [Deltaproteobacteria bacterium]
MPSAPRPAALLQPTRRQPLLVRPGARFVCQADGVCCSDVHVLGPITPAELVPLRALHAQPAAPDASVKGLAFRTQSGGCVFLRDDHLCRVHAELGVTAKPATCRRFPFNLVQTPAGLRVVTPHRCPCRTLGPRPPLTVEAVTQEIVIPEAPLAPDYAVAGLLRVAGKQRVRFSEWCTIEAQWLHKLQTTHDLAAALAAPAFAPGFAWNKLAAKLKVAKDGSSFETAKSCVGHAIGAALDGAAIPRLERPWARFFDAGERRVQAAPQSSDVMLADWLADEVWSLRWVQDGSFAQHRTDLATRLAIACQVQKALVAAGVDRTRATAEALLVIDVITHSELWFGVSRGLGEP